MEHQDGGELCFPQHLNASCRKPKISQSKTVLLYFLFYFIFSGFSVALNLLVIISAAAHTHQSPILSLAVSDFLFGFMTLLESYKQTTCWFLGDLICSLYVYVNSIILGASVGNMILISVDRYVAIRDPLHYPIRATVTRVKMCVCMCWTCSVVYNGLIFKDFLDQPGQYRSCYGKCVGGTDNISGMIDNVLSSLAPVTVIIILYIRVFVTAVAQARAMRSHVLTATHQPSGAVTTKKSELKAARTLGVAVVVFLLCFCPYFSCAFVPADSVGHLYDIGYFLLQISPCLNPVIYALFYPWFRKALRLIFSLQILQPGSRETNMM
ncbi:hypothetical protein Q5P01_013148 [Channa striata]|uniref:G-protein coupled receptors family 1 profile domain-containing protein n=1 Tax=Channa striata TaxID=64152 RepID=A0AA88MIU9_CHASR|nr:hypothetical protein Q5P01_013148 [Channa striata]